MKFPLIYLTFWMFVVDVWGAERTVIYPDIIPGAKLEILTVPGFRSFEDCKPKCKITQTIPYNQEIVTTGQKQVRSYQNIDGDTIVEEFVEVETMVDQKLVKGWVPSDLTSRQPPEEETTTPETHNGWFSTTSSETTPAKSRIRQFCSDIIDSFTPTRKFVPSESDMHSISQKAKEDAARAKLPLLQTTKIVEQLIGKCAVENPKDLSEKDLKSPISYDSIVLPKLLSEKVTIYKRDKDQTVAVNQSAMLHVRDLNIPHLNAQKLIEIDALSRTIFAEMAGCIPIGQQYAMAVARVIKNREKVVEKMKAADFKKAEGQGTQYNPVGGNEFMWEKKDAIHWPGKNISTKVATSPVQFSGWNNYIIDSNALKEAREAKRKELIAAGTKPADAAKLAREQIKENPETREFYKFNKSGMQHTLCPPSRPDEPYYTGKKPYPELLAIWHNTVKIAVEATLYPEQFTKKTDSLKDVLHYTSGRSSFYGFCQFKDPIVDGKKLDSNRCLNLWIDPKRQPQLCKLATEEAEAKAKSEPKGKEQKRAPAKNKEKKKLKKKK